MLKMLFTMTHSSPPFDLSKVGILAIVPSSNLKLATSPLDPVATGLRAIQFLFSLPVAAGCAAAVSNRPEYFLFFLTLSI
jgi:hypothetical protein